MGLPQNYVSVPRRPPDVEDYIDILRRYRPWILGPTFAGLVVGVVVAFLWPDTYLSQAVMRITPPLVPASLVPSAVNSQISERLTQMEEEIESRTSLSDMIQRLNLYPKQRQRKPMTDVVEDMKGAIKIPLLDVGTQGPNRNMAAAFAVQFRYPDKHLAQAVVRELVSKFTEQNETVLHSQSVFNTGFLSDESQAAKDNLNRIDQEITKFRMQNLGHLPEQYQANLANLQSLQQELASGDEELNRVQGEKVLMETQLDNYKSQLAYYQSNVEQDVGGVSQTVKNQRLIDLNKMITEANAQLKGMLTVYKETHPDVKNFRARLAALVQERDTLEQQEAATQAATPTPAVEKFTNPQMEKAVKDTQAVISILNTQIRNKDGEIADRVKEQQRLKKAIDIYQARIEQSPITDQQFAALQREYQIAKDNFDDKAKRREMAETSQNLEDRKGGETLEEIDPPSLPEEPVDPNKRLTISSAGAAAGLILGIILAGAKEVKNTSLKNLKDVRAYTNLPILSSIPLLENALLVRRKRRLFWLAWSTAIIIGTLAMSGSVFYYLSTRT
jgi:polysaccharide biosynthesis transport protein